MNYRPIEEVIDALSSVIPESEPLRPALEEQFSKLKLSCRCTAPEAMYLRWNDLGLILERTIGVPLDTDWKRLVSQIITGEADYRDHLCQQR